MADHNEMGKYGEDLAEGYLKEKGFDILHRNWRHSRYEIDIIASYKDTLHFIEVKTRGSKAFGLPEEGVSFKKMKQLGVAANAFLQQNAGWKWIQHDILSVTISKEKEPEYFFIQDVWVGAGNLRI